MILYQVHNSLVFSDETFIYYAKDYYDYVVQLVKDSLYLHPWENINVIIGNYSYIFNNSNPVIRIDINFEHTLVVPGGRDSDFCPCGVIPVLYNNAQQKYLVRIENLSKLIQNDIIIDYSVPNLMNISSSELYPDYMKKTICLSPLLYPTYIEKGNREIQCITTFINTEEPRRKRLLESIPGSLHHRNINNCFERNAIIELYRNTKILVNIHQTDHHHTCEELRILPALLSGVIVISEDSPLKEYIPYYEYIIWVKYEDIIGCVEKVQNSYDEYFTRIFGDGRLLGIIEEMEKKNRDVLQGKLFRMNTNFYHVPFGQFSDNALKTTHNAGFFSCCSVLLHMIVHYINTYKRLPQFVDTGYTLDWYKPEGQSSRNIFPDYFTCDENMKIEYTRDINYTENDQFKNFELLDFEKLSPLIQKYFQPSDEIKGIMREIESKYSIDYENTCALFLRGNDKSTECTIPEYDFYRTAVKDIREKNPDIRFMVQSDETEFIETMSSELSNYFVCKDEIRHINKSVTTVDAVFKHLNYDFSKKFLAIIIIMSKCKHVVCNYGNCSIWITLFRGNVNYLVEYFVQ
jgi:hypothetical protein